MHKKIKSIFICLILFGAVSVPFFDVQSESDKPVKRFKLLAGGDIMFDWGLRQVMQSKGKFVPVDNLLPLFIEADFSMANLETPVSETAEDIDRLKSYVFNAKPAEMEVLNRLGIDLVFLANNHTMDYGVKGIEETFRHLKKYNLHHVGAGRNLKESYLPFTVAGLNARVYSVSQIGETRLFATEKKPGAAPFVMSKLKGLPDKTKLNILSVHWGQEYNPHPMPSQITNAHELINAGFRIIIGHHPHIPQGIEKYKNGIIFYSLGNFIFGSRNPYLNHNMTVMLHFENETPVLAEIIPVFGKFQEAEHIFGPVKTDEAESFLQEIAVLSLKLNTKIEIKNGRGYIRL